MWMKRHARLAHFCGGKQNESRFPVLARMARKYLSVPATSGVDPGGFKGFHGTPFWKSLNNSRYSNRAIIIFREAE